MITYDAEADAVYIYLAAIDTLAALTKIVDDARIVDYDAKGAVVGVELLGASAGLDLRGLPEQARLEAEAKYITFPTLV